MGQRFQIYAITEGERYNGTFKEFPYIKRNYLWGGKFWSRSTFVATVGSVSLEVVKKYIENQGK